MSNISSVGIPILENKLNVSWNTSILRMVGEKLKSESPTEYKKYIKLDNDGKLEYIENLEVEFDKNLLKNINAILHPLLNKVITEEISKEIIENHIPKYYGAKHNIIEFRIILQKYANSIKTRSYEEESRLSLPYYLIIIESSFTANINLLIYLLIKNNITYNRKMDDNKKYEDITDFKKIDKEKLSNKLSFLENNGFSIISDTCDRDLRNSIAHMDFIVFSDGSVAYGMNKLKTVTKKNLENNIEKLLNVCHCIEVSIGQFFKQKYDFK